MSKNIDLTIVDDGFSDPGETIDLTLSNSVNAIVGNISAHTFTIIDSTQTAASLEFVQHPTNAASQTSISPSITVRALDAGGNVVTGYTSNVTLSISTNPGSGNITGTVTRAAVSGVATFNDIKIDEAGTGYKLEATDSTLTSSESNAFNITLPVPTLEFKLATSSEVQGVGLAVDPNDSDYSYALVEIELSASSTQDIDVDVVDITGSDPGDAVDPADYSLYELDSNFDPVPFDGTITIAQGTTIGNLIIRYYNHPTYVGDKIIEFQLTNPVNASIGTQDEHVFTITDDLSASYCSGSLLTNVPFADGDGSENDPYTICTKTQLKAVQTDGLGDPTLYFKLMSDIDLSGGDFAPLGNDPGDVNYTVNLMDLFGGNPPINSAFMGKFDGNGKVLSNWDFQDDTLDFVGIFALVGPDAIISNISLTNISIIGKLAVSGIAAVNMGGIINRCSVSSGVIIADTDLAAGIVAINIEGQIRNSFNKANIKVLDTNGSGTFYDLMSGGADPDGPFKYIAGGITGLNGGDLINNYSAVDEFTLHNDAFMDYIGYVLGFPIGGSFENNFYLDGASVVGPLDPLNSQNFAPYVSAKTDAQLKQKATFTNWDFDDFGVWSIVENTSYPTHGALIIDLPFIAGIKDAGCVPSLNNLYFSGG